MQNILSLLQNAFKIRLKFRRIHLKGLGFSPFSQRSIKRIKAHGLPQIIGVYPSVQFIMKADISNISVLKMLQGQIRRRATAQHKIFHITSQAAPSAAY